MKKHISIAGILCLSVLLSGCGTPSEDKKQDFLVQTKFVSDFWREVLITKPGRIAGTEEITVTSQVNGRIGKKIKKDGDQVAVGQPILQIDDSVANYSLQVQRSKNALDRSLIQYTQTKVAVDKWLSDSETALEAAENAYNTSQKTIILQFPVQKNSLLSSLDSILHQLNTYLGVTDSYKTYNDAYDLYLWAKDNNQRVQTEKMLRTLYTLRDQIQMISTDTPTPPTIASGVVVMNTAYIQARNLLDSMMQVLLNSIPNSSLPQSTIDGYKATVDGLKSALQMSNTSFAAYHTQVDSTYTAKRIVSQDTLLDSDIGIKNAKNNYDAILQNKDLQVSMAENGVADAQVGYQDALTKLNKLSARSPIAGVIGTVMVDVWQEVAPWTPLFTIVSSQNQMIEVFVTAEEYDFLRVDQLAHVLYAGDTFTGKVVSLSSVADRNTLYKVIVALDRAVSLIGDVATVSLPVKVNTPVLPLNSITPLSANAGYISIFHETGVQKYDVQMWRVWDDLVQITSSLPDGLDVILSDISTFDSEKFVLKKE